jgi:hypothetical protein
MARSARNHHAVFFEKMAILLPAGSFSATRCAATRRASPSPCDQV